MATYDELKKHLKGATIKAKVLGGIASTLAITALPSLMYGSIVSGELSDRLKELRGEKLGYSKALYSNADYKAYVHNSMDDSKEQLDNGEITFDEYKDTLDQYYTTDHAYNWAKTECTDSSITQQARYYDKTIAKQEKDVSTTSSLALYGILGTVGAGISLFLSEQQKNKKKEIYAEMEKEMEA